MQARRAAARAGHPRAARPSHCRSGCGTRGSRRRRSSRSMSESDQITVLGRIAVCDKAFAWRWDDRRRRLEGSSRSRPGLLGWKACRGKVAQKRNALAETRSPPRAAASRPSGGPHARRRDARQNRPTNAKGAIGKRHRVRRDTFRRNHWWTCRRTLRVEPRCAAPCSRSRCRNGPAPNGMNTNRRICDISTCGHLRGLRSAAKTSLRPPLRSGRARAESSGREEAVENAPKSPGGQAARTRRIFADHRACGGRNRQRKRNGSSRAPRRREQIRPRTTLPRRRVQTGAT